MGFKCGIVGLPNVGKSSLFNALSDKAKAESANYPFCTIEPNKTLVSVPDNRLNILMNIEKSEKTVSTFIEIVDIAGIVSGAHKGEGLGNKFLSHIREMDVIIMLLRCFDDANVIHVNNKVDPVSELNILCTELALADIETLERKLSKKNTKQAEEMIRNIISILENWNAEKWIASTKMKVESYKKPVRAGDVDHLGLFQSLASTIEQSEILCGILSECNLFTCKPLMCVCNVNDEDVGSGNHHTEKIDCPIIVSASLEASMIGMTSEEKLETLREHGVDTTGLDKIISYGYKLLNCITYFTVGEKEARAWTIKNGYNAQQAAACIHTDISVGFIKAKVISYDDFIKCNGRKNAKDSGKLRIEGKDYKVVDGDVILFEHKLIKNKYKE